MVYLYYWLRVGVVSGVADDALEEDEVGGAGHLAARGVRHTSIHSGQSI